MSDPRSSLEKWRSIVNMDTAQTDAVRMEQDGGVRTPSRLFTASRKGIRPIPLTFKVVGAAPFREFVFLVDFQSYS